MGERLGGHAVNDAGRSAQRFGRQKIHAAAPFHLLAKRLIGSRNAISAVGLADLQAKTLGVFSKL